MFSNNIQLKLKKAGLVFSLLTGAVILTSASDVSAQGNSRQAKQQQKHEKQIDKLERKRERIDDRYESQQDRIDDRRNNGNGNRNNGNYGNNGNNGNNGGYYGNNGNGNNGSGNSYAIARQNGYRDGLRAGAQDARNGNRYSPQRHSDFRNASDGYNSRYGNRGQYQQAYRNAFVEGYRESYNRSARSNNGRWGN